MRRSVHRNEDAPILILPLAACGLLTLTGPAPAGPVAKGTAGLAGATVLPLQNGPNTVDLLGDGTRATVFVARKENFNAHGYSSIAFYLHSGYDRSDSAEWQLLPFVDRRADRDVIRTEEGADCTLMDFRVLRVRPHAAVVVIIARREQGESFADSVPVQFDVYRLQRNREGLPGWPTYYFQFERSIPASRPYCDVNEAFQQELGLGHVGLGRGDGGR